MQMTTVLSNTNAKSIESAKVVGGLNLCVKNQNGTGARNGAPQRCYAKPAQANKHTGVRAFDFAGIAG